MRLLSISLAIATARNGAVMIDEVENGLHYTILQSVWRSISTLSKEYNVQVFATTHSLECIHSAHLATKGLATNDFGLHRLERVDGAIQSVHYDQQALSIAFEEEWEMR